MKRKTTEDMSKPATREDLEKIKNSWREWEDRFKKISAELDVLIRDLKKRGIKGSRP